MFYLPSANCYKKVLQETQAMQDKIEKELGLNPVDKSVVVLYDGEKGEQVGYFSFVNSSNEFAFI